MHRQRKFGVRTSFEFGDERVTYGVGDAISRKNFLIDYSALNLEDSGEFSISNNQYFLRWTPLLLVIVLMIVFVSPEVPGAIHWFGALLAVSVFVVAALGIAIGYEVAEVTFTEIPTFGSDSNGVRGFVRIIRDRRHDIILDELRKHWRERMRQLHYNLRLDVGIENEEARLMALFRHGIISEDEHHQMRDTLYRELAMRDTERPASTH